MHGEDCSLLRIFHKNKEKSKSQNRYLKYQTMYSYMFRKLSVLRLFVVGSFL